MPPRVNKNLVRADAPEDDFDETLGLCDLFRATFCFWECSRDYCFSSGSRCARVRDLACSCVSESVKTRWVGTSREREIAKYVDPLERKEFLGTLSAAEARILRKRRQEAALYVRQRALDSAPEQQRMEALRAGIMSRSIMHKELKGGVVDANRARDEVSVMASDEIGKEEARERRELARRWGLQQMSSESSDDDSDDASSYTGSSYTGSSFDEYSSHSGSSSYVESCYSSDEHLSGDAMGRDALLEDSAVAAPTRMDKQGRPLVVGRDLAYANEGLLTAGLQRWEAYIVDASLAGAVRDEREAQRAERRNQRLRNALNELDVYAQEKNLTAQDVEIRRKAIVDAHERFVSLALERQHARVERERRKQALLESLSHEERAKLIRKWALEGRRP